MAERPLLLFVHGWGFGSGVWRPVVRALPSWRYRILDLGFFGRPQHSIPEGEPLLAVGHSLGFLWLLRRMDQASWRRNCLGLVSIAGFSRFSRSTDFPDGMAPKVLRSMAQRLPSDVSGVLTAFQQRSGWLGGPGHGSIQNSESLLQGLSWLQEWDGRAALAAWDGPLSALAAQDDQIVSPKLTSACFAPHTVRWLADGGHILPLTRAEACARTIERLGACL